MNFPPYYQPDAAPDSLTQPGFSHAEYHHPPIQQIHGLYSISDAPTVGHEAQYQAGQAADLLFPVQQPFNGGDGQGAFAYVPAPAPAPTSSFTTLTGPPSSMGPPNQSRKRKAPTLSEADWKPCKARVLDLFFAQEVPLPKVKQIIEEEYDFKAELRQYRSRIHQWGKDRNVKPHEMQAIVRKRQKRMLVETGKAQLKFNVRGKPVEPHKIERWMKRHSVVESALYVPSPAAPTPSDVGCYTISDRGSPAVLSAYSPGAGVLSPEGVYVMAQSPQMPSPASSAVSDIFRAQKSTFTGQSPALAYTTLAQPHYSFSHASIDMSSQMDMDIDAQPRYRGVEEERLRDQIAQAELSVESNHKERSQMLRMLVVVLIDQGRFRAAEEVARRLVASYESQSETGEDDEGELQALNLLGEVFQNQGLNQKAERLHRRVQRRTESLFGVEHPITLTTFGYLGSVLRKQGKYDEAEAMHRRALEVREKVLGAEHPNTLNSINSLGGVLESQGKHGEAEAMYRRAVEGSEKVLGVEHPHTLTSVHNLAFLLHEQQRYPASLELYQRAYEGFAKVLGVQHPRTKACFEEYESAKRHEIL